MLVLQAQTCPDVWCPAGHPGPVVRQSVTSNSVFLIASHNVYFKQWCMLWLWFHNTLTISPLNVCFQTLDPLNSSSSDNFDEKIVNNCISNLYITAKLVTTILQLSQTKFISSLVQENIFDILTSSKISLRSLGLKWLSVSHNTLSVLHIGMFILNLGITSFWGVK